MNELYIIEIVTSQDVTGKTASYFHNGEEMDTLEVPLFSDSAAAFAEHYQMTYMGATVCGRYIFASQ